MSITTTLPAIAHAPSAHQGETKTQPEAGYKGLRMTLKRPEVRNDVEEEDDGASSGKKDEEYFEF